MRLVPQQRVLSPRSPRRSTGLEDAMGNFEKLSVLVIVVIIVMILVVALYTWSDNPDAASSGTTVAVKPSVDPLKTEQPGGGRIIIPPLPQTPVVEKSTLGTPGLLNGSSTLPAIGGPQAPAAVQTPAPEAKPEPTSHEIVAGDTLGKIAKKYHVSVGAIEEANPGIDSMRLGLGKKIMIPAPKGASAPSEVAKKDGKSDGNASTIRIKEPVAAVRPGTVYTFVKGDTLPSLSKRAYGTADRWHEIWIANYAAIENPDVVAPGTRVKLPAR
jgi:LysM repeat protein